MRWDSEQSILRSGLKAQIFGFLLPCQRRVTRINISCPLLSVIFWCPWNAVVPSPPAPPTIDPIPAPLPPPKTPPSKAPAPAPIADERWLFGPCRLTQSRLPRPPFHRMVHGKAQ
jgi:hypothetical protein